MSDRRDRIAQAALSHVPCSSVAHLDVYEDVVRRVVDRVPLLDDFYLHNRLMSSCGLFAIGTVRLAGCVEPECVAPYFPHNGPERNAVADVQTLARRFGAWRTASPPVAAFQKGDIWIIADARGMDAHVGVCTADALVSSGADAWTVATCEGGQFSGKDSSACGAFTRTFVLDGARWRLGSRYLLGYASAGDLPVPDDHAPDDTALAAPEAA